MCLHILYSFKQLLLLMDLIFYFTTALCVKITVYWDVTLHSMVGTNVSRHVLLPFSGWKMEAAGSSRTLITICQYMWHHFPEDYCNHFFLHAFSVSMIIVCVFHFPLYLYSFGRMFRKLQYTRNWSYYFTWNLTALIGWIGCMCVCVHVCARTCLCAQ